MKKTRFYPILVTIYLLVTAVMLTLYYSPDLSQYASYSILEPEEVVSRTEGLISKPFSASSPLKLSAFVEIDRLPLLVTPRVEVFSWMALAIFIFGQGLVVFGYRYYRFSAAKLIIPVFFVSLFMLPPSVHAVEIFSGKTSESLVKPGDIVTYWLLYENVGVSDLQNVQLTIPIPRGMVYIPETTLLSTVSPKDFNDELSGVLATDVSDPDPSLYDLERKQLILTFPTMESEREEKIKFVIFKLQVKEEAVLPEEIVFTATGVAHGYKNAEAKASLIVDPSYAL